MFSITRLNIQWGTPSATYLKMGHFLRALPIPVSVGPILALTMLVVFRTIVLHKRRKQVGKEIMLISFKFVSKVQVQENNSLVFWNHSIESVCQSVSSLLKIANLFSIILKYSTNLRTSRNILKTYNKIFSLT